MHPYSFVDSDKFFTFLLPYLLTSLLIYCFIVPVLCFSIFSYECMFALVALDLVFQYQAKRFAGKNVSEMTYFVSGGT